MGNCPFIQTYSAEKGLLVVVVVIEARSVVTAQSISESGNPWAFTSVAQWLVASKNIHPTAEAFFTSWNYRIATSEPVVKYLVTT